MKKNINLADGIGLTKVTWKEDNNLSINIEEERAKVKDLLTKDFITEAFISGEYDSFTILLVDILLRLELDRFFNSIYLEEHEKKYLIPSRILFKTKIQTTYQKIPVSFDSAVVRGRVSRSISAYSSLGEDGKILKPEHTDLTLCGGPISELAFKDVREILSDENEPKEELFSGVITMLENLVIRILDKIPFLRTENSNLQKLFFSTNLSILEKVLDLQREEQDEFLTIGEQSFSSPFYFSSKRFLSAIGGMEIKENFFVEALEKGNKIPVIDLSKAEHMYEEDKVTLALEFTSCFLRLRKDETYNYQDRVYHSYNIFSRNIKTISNGHTSHHFVHYFPTIPFYNTRGLSESILTSVAKRKEKEEVERKNKECLAKMKETIAEYNLIGEIVDGPLFNFREALSNATSNIFF